jgi:23S rRNA (cytidine1920-2'-O)/16S rRNA (cytidine1409-2'-O)-methyltransferase
MKKRLDQELVRRGLVATRSQAESYIKLGYAKVGKEVVKKPGFGVMEDAKITIATGQQYVSRAALKLKSVAKVLQLDFRNKVVLDVGSSTGGFTEFALRHGARKVVAVDVGTNQLHPALRFNPKIELHEQTDIRDYVKNNHKNADRGFCDNFGVIMVDVSFISLREVLPYVHNICTPNTKVVAMVKPQFETGLDSLKHKGVVKNEAMRRNVLKQFECWVQKVFIIINKADSDVPGAKGNTERFYMLKMLPGTKPKLAGIQA